MSISVELGAELLLEGLKALNTLGQAIAKARSEGRKELTKDELDAFRTTDNAVKSALQSEIDAQASAQEQGDAAKDDNGE